MKKFAAVLCAVMSLCCAGNAFAAIEGNALTDGSRNNVGTLSDKIDNTTNLPCFRPGDTLSFNISGLKENEQLTLISYKYDATSIDNETIQYIDQKTVKSTTDTVKYKIRDVEQGIYSIKLKTDSESLYTLYYKVGKPEVKLVKGKDGNTWAVKIDAEDNTSSLGYVGLITIGSQDVSFADVGVTDVGFEFKADRRSGESKLVNDKDTTLDEILESTAEKTETSGTISFYFAQTLNNVPKDVTVDVEAKMYSNTGSADVSE